MVKGDNEVAPDPEFPEQFRSYSENEKHWQARRAFILRNSPLEGGEAPLRYVWTSCSPSPWFGPIISSWDAGQLFRGTRSSYSKDLLEKVTEMADGIEVEDVPHFTTRDELIKRINTSA
ncbi:hypothetical protein E2320_015429 [Naja naja]|nr:hypothetical protein E2320_015429 [Naja naja]